MGKDKPPLGAYQRWLERLESGALGEDPTRCSTWVLDELWRAACRDRNQKDYLVSIGQWPGERG